MSNATRAGIGEPLSAFAPGFVEHLVRQGYRPDPAVKQLRLMAHLSRWLAGRDLVGRDLTSTRVEQFLTERRQSHRRCISAKGIKPLLDYLRDLGVVPAAAPAEPHTPGG